MSPDLIMVTSFTTLIVDHLTDNDIGVNDGSGAGQDGVDYMRNDAVSSDAAAQDESEKMDGHDVDDGCASDTGDGTATGLVVHQGSPPPYSATGPPMRKRYRPTPLEELPDFDGPCFVLARAEETGLFQTWYVHCLSSLL